MLLKRVSLLLLLTASLFSCKEASVENKYPNLKDLKVNLDAVPTIFKNVADSRKQGAFATFAIEHNDDSINIQFSYEDGSVGLDWVLLGDANIQDKDKFEEYLKSQGIKIEKKMLNNVSYLRVTQGDLAQICIDVLVKLCGIKKEDLFDVYYQGIDLEKYVQQIAYFRFGHKKRCLCCAAAAN